MSQLSNTQLVLWSWIFHEISIVNNEAKSQLLCLLLPLSHAVKEAVATKPGAERLPSPQQQLEPGSLVLLGTPPSALSGAPQGLWKPVLVSDTLLGSRTSLRNV